MESTKLAMSILAIVAVLALASLVLVHREITAMMGAPTYEQPSGNKPAFLHTSKYVGGFNLCQQYLCSYPIPGEYYAEAEPAFEVGRDFLTGNLRCGCTDGREFHVRPDFIMEGYG